MARVRLSVDIEKETKHQIAVLAARRGITMSDLVVEAVCRILVEERAERLMQKPSSLAGVLRQYADNDKRAQEEFAWSQRVSDDIR